MNIIHTHFPSQFRARPLSFFLSYKFQVATARAALRDAEKSLLEGATSLQMREVIGALRA